MRQVHIYREIENRAEHIGLMAGEGDEARFFYDGTYLESEGASEISLSLPLQASQPLPAAFFENLVPEGERRRLYSTAFRVSTGNWTGVLSELGNESIGALLLTEHEETPLLDQQGHALGKEDFERFAISPKRAALQLGMAARLSLAGAQTKLGLRNTTGKWDSGWEVPVGFSASTHILKADDGTFPGQIANEALCLAAARKCGLDVAETRMLEIGNQPVLAVRRFDRTIDADGSVSRRHQEDFCQAGGLKSSMKYEPTDGHYANSCSRLLSRASNNPFGDRVLFFESVLFDYLIGNCDNHLKNKSFLWDSHWQGREFSPLYDISCTTVYPELDREMGIGLSAARVIDSVTIASISETAKSAGLPEDMAINMLRNLQRKLPDALSEAIREIGQETSSDVAEMGNRILEDIRPRCALA